MMMMMMMMQTAIIRRRLETDAHTSQLQHAATVVAWTPATAVHFDYCRQGMYRVAQKWGHFCD